MNNLNVYHGDIKSENVMIKNNTPRLIDWGSAFIQKNDAFKRMLQVVLFNSIFLTLVSY